MPRVKTAAFVTLGCKINQYETEAIREEVLDLGYREVPYTSPADVYVVNTCSVTATSGTKSRKYVQRAARTNPDARIIVVGCSTPSEKDKLSKIPQVAVLAGNEEKAMVGRLLGGAGETGQGPASPSRSILSLRISGYSHRTRANVKVQDGCNSFCSFCIIPFLRGRSASRTPQTILDEVRGLAEGGYKEVVISGVHLQDYGEEFDPPVTLAALLRRVAEVEGLSRIRLSSVNPRAFTPELLDLLENPIFCPHWHISLQSGSDHVLERMRRDYRMDDFRGLVAKLYRRFEDPSIATDVIVGHPGESDADFEETLEVCRELAFSKIHVFPYSVREGTLAAKLGGHVAPGEIRERAGRLRELEKALGSRYRERLLGRTVEVLVEGSEGSPARDESPRSSTGREFLGGLTERYVRVGFRCPSERARERFPGTLQPVRVSEVRLPEEAPVVRGEWVGEVQ
jgi:threonylcarbamoyladenosine tRNA methylthiotransferase MtaB